MITPAVDLAPKGASLGTVMSIESIKTTSMENISTGVLEKKRTIFKK